MRKMDYCRYDSPTYTGTFGELSSFHLDRPVEPGIYMVVMTDPANEKVFTFNFTVKDGLSSHADFMSWVNDSLASITLWASEKNRIEVDYGLGEGSTIELYKLN